jgi:hypothetical protein
MTHSGCLAIASIFLQLDRELISPISKISEAMAEDFVSCSPERLLPTRHPASTSPTLGQVSDR